MINKGILLLFISCFSWSLFGQEFHVSWGEIEKDAGMLEIVSAYNGEVVVQGIYDELFKQQPQYFLTKFDTNQVALTSIAVEKLSTKEYFSIGTIDSPKGLAHFYAEIGRRNKSMSINVQYYEHKDLKISKKDQLAKFDIRSKEILHILDGTIPNVRLPITLHLSEDRSKIGLLIKQDKVGKRKITNFQYAVFDVINGFDLLHSGDFDTDNKSKMYSFNKSYLSDKGLFAILLRSYDSKSKRTTINKRPGFKNELHVLRGEGKSYIYDINEKKYFIQDIEFVVDTMDNIYLTGSLRVKSLSKNLGTYLLKLNREGEKTFEFYKKLSSQEITMVDNRSRDYISKKYKTIKILLNDSFIFVVKQYRDLDSYSTYRNNAFRGRYYGYYNNNYQNTSYYHDFRNVIFEAYSRKTGQKKWFSVLPMNQEEPITKVEEPDFSDGVYKVIDGELHCFYNERSRNINRIHERKSMNNTDLSKNHTLTAMAKIDNTGIIYMTTLDQENRLLLPSNSVFLDSFDLYFLQQTHNYKQYSVGKLIVD